MTHTACYTFTIRRADQTIKATFYADGSTEFRVTEPAPRLLTDEEKAAVRLPIDKVAEAHAMLCKQFASQTEGLRIYKDAVDALKDEVKKLKHDARRYIVTRDKRAFVAGLCARQHRGTC